MSEPTAIDTVSRDTDVPRIVERLRHRIRVARGEEPADLLLTGGQIVNVFTQSIQSANVILVDGYIAGVGPHDWAARETIDLTGQTLLPGLFDAHMHLESTLLSPAEFARLVVPHGTAAVVADPHEIGNVLGIPGIEMILAASAGLPLDLFYMASPCVPCTAWEHAGATLGLTEIATLLAQPQILGLAEVMDFPAVLTGDEQVLAKVAEAWRRGAAVDGHAPGVMGRDLVAYTAAGVRADHESSTAEEARQKAALGMLVQVREGSIARNLETLLPLILAHQLGDWTLCTDDIHPDELVRVGHLDGLLRRLMAAGVDPAHAVRHATLVPARHYGFRDRGAIAPSYRADLAVVRGDLRQMQISLVIKNGQVVARDGEYLFDGTTAAVDCTNTVHLGNVDEGSFRLRLPRPTAPAIGIVPGQLVTHRLTVESKIDSDGHWQFDPELDVALLASLERHRASGSIGLGLVQGFGFQRHGALASSVAHDSHNLIVAGTNPRDMLVCVRALEQSGGGFVAAAEGQVLAQLPLPVAGLLSPEPATEVCRQLAAARAAAASLGCTLASPFGMLSFLALPVIPQLKLTDQGLFDVIQQEFVPV